MSIQFNITKFFTSDISSNQSKEINMEEDTALYYSNYDLSTIVMPVNVDKLVLELKQHGYEEEKIDFLQNGFTNRFDIGYQGPEQRQSTSRNLPLRVGNKTELWNKLMKEVQLK